MKEITYDDFWAYENLRRSGEINMFQIDEGCELSGLSRKQYIYIMKNYEELRNKYDKG